ncbi:hypothetical protein J14TS5_56660 [Paenibacillus lautus]|nr:hypothetical protein J14TS5_56660 [Paenibacillus lautus]
MEKLPSLKNWNLFFKNDQDNHAEFINSHYKKLLPIEGPNTLKFSITNAIVEYAALQSNFHIILSNSNLNKSVEQTQRSKAIFRSASSFIEVLERQGKSGEQAIKQSIH